MKRLALTGREWRGGEVGIGKKMVKRVDGWTSCAPLGHIQTQSWNRKFSQTRYACFFYRMDPLPGSLVAELDNLQRRMAFLGLCTVLEQKSLDESLVSLNARRLTKWLFIGLLLASRIASPYYYCASRIRLSSALVRARGATSLSFKWISNRHDECIVTWIFSLSRQEIFASSIFLRNLTFVVVVSRKNRKFQQRIRSKFPLSVVCFSDFFFFFSKF